MGQVRRIGSHFMKTRNRAQGRQAGQPLRCGMTRVTVGLFAPVMDANRNSAGAP